MATKEIEIGEITNHKYAKIMTSLDTTRDFNKKLWAGDKQMENILIDIICNTRDENGAYLCYSREQYFEFRKDFIKKYPQVIKAMKECDKTKDKSCLIA